jgi:hypothetical protein
VGPVQGSKHVRHGGLHAERDPVDATVTQPAQRIGVHGVGIGFGAHLGVRNEPEPVTDGAQDAGQLLGRQQCRSAAAEEHRGSRRGVVAEDPGGQVQLGDDSRGVRRPGCSRLSLSSLAV